jgi:5,5'-dehydrodivanillate O-demethylase
MLGASDRGVVMLRHRFLKELEALAAGAEPKGLIREPQKNHRVRLPMMSRERVLASLSTQDILADPVKKRAYTTFILQAGQPESVRRQFSQAMGIEATEFDGLVRASELTTPTRGDPP